MSIAVLIKHVPDTETKIQIKPDNSGIVQDNVKYIMNPYDEFAVEAAIQLGEKTGKETTVISMGDAGAVDSLRTALAMGIQKAVHVETDGEWYDAFTTATALSSVLKEGGYEVILCGKQAIDSDNSQTVSMVAELMDIAQVNVVEELSMDGEALTAVRRVGGGGKETYKPSLPAILGAEKGLNTPRYASLPGIMKAKSKPVDKKSAKDLLNGAGNLISFSNYNLPPERKAGQVIDGDSPQAKAASLVKMLREEAKVI